MPKRRIIRGRRSPTHLGLLEGRDVVQLGPELLELRLDLVHGDFAVVAFALHVDGWELMCGRILFFLSFSLFLLSTFFWERVKYERLSV